MTLSVAIVGCGAIARRAHLPALRAAGAHVAVLSSRTAASAEAAREEAGGGEIVAHWQDAVAHDGVDAVIVCTPNDLHEPVALAAAAAGKHVLVEKPMAVSLDAADRMIRAATEAGVVLMPAHNVRFAAPFAAAADAVARGAIGEVTGVRAAFGHGGPHLWAPEATWFRDVARSGGGALIDLGVHVADLLRAVLRDELVSVGAAVHRDGDVDDDAHVVVTFASGATGSFHVSWISRPGPDHQLTVVGTEGTLHLDGRTPLTRFGLGGAAPEVVALPEVVSNPVAELMRAAGGEPASLSAADGRASLAVVVAAYEAARLGKVVDVDRSTP